MADRLATKLMERTPEALAVALTTWRKTPSPGLGALIHQRSAALPAATTTWPKSTEAFQAHWLTLAEKASDELRPLLLATLGTKAFDGRFSERFMERLDCIALWPTDPRTAAALQETLEHETRRARDGLGTEPMLLRLLALLVKQKDSRTIAWLERYESHNPCRVSLLRASLERAARRARARLALVPDPSWLAPLLPGPTPKSTRPDPDELITAVLAAPMNRALREVLQDVLLEAGDPRGPFFTLSLAATTRALTDAETKRLATLERTLRKALLGPLFPIAKQVVFRDGFVDELELAGSWKASGRLWKEALDSPWLNTVRHLAKGDAWEDTWVDVLERAPVSLRSAGTTSTALSVIGGTRAAERLEVLRIDGAPTSSTKKALTRFPKLREISVSGPAEEVVGWLVAAPPLERVVASVTATSTRSPLAGVDETVVAVALAWHQRTKHEALEVNGWLLRRAGAAATLEWSREPIWGDAEAWALVGLTRAQALRLSKVSAVFAPKVLNLTPALRKALGPLLPATTTRA
jgi:hypothetical protein